MSGLAASCAIAIASASEPGARPGTGPAASDALALTISPGGIGGSTGVYADPWVEFDAQFRPLSGSEGVAAPAAHDEAAAPAAHGEAAAPAAHDEAAAPAAREAAAAADDVWARIRQGMALEAPAEPVTRQIEWLRRHHGLRQYNAANMRRFLPFVVERMELAGLPLELALLPLVESAYNPVARSSAGALGLWQFMPATARRYGLRSFAGYDARLDVPAATHAAIRMLTELHAQFDSDWLLAVAAYNAGEGAVQRARRQNREAGEAADFWSLKLPRETRRYVRRWLAASQVVSEPERHGFELARIGRAAYFDAVDVSHVGRPLPLELAAELARVSAEEISRLNTGLTSGATARVNGAHRLLVPANRGNVLLARLSALPIERIGAAASLAVRTGPARRGSWREHRIRSGESLFGIARRYGTSVRELKRANDLAGSFIRAGSSLLVPSSAQIRSDMPQRHAAGPASTHPVKAVGAHSDRLDYQVRAGDSLWNIARRFRVTVGQLRRWNALAEKGYLRPGQVLEVYIRPARQT